MGQNSDNQPSLSTCQQQTLMPNLNSLHTELNKQLPIVLHAHPQKGSTKVDYQINRREN